MPFTPDSATVGFSDVTSANVVGYINDTMVDGYKAVAAPFSAVGSVEKGFNLSDMIVEGADPITSSVNPVTIQTLKADGTGGDTYTYHYNDTATAYKNGNGWYDKKRKLITKEADVFFPVGTGLWLKGNATLKFVTSGEVLFDSVQIDLVDGYRLVGNPFAAKMQLSKIVASGADQITSSLNAINLQTLNVDGTGGDTYTYHLKDTATAYKNGDGWYDKKRKLITSDNEIEFSAGVSLWVKGNSSLSLRIITPFEDAE